MSVFSPTFSRIHSRAIVLIAGILIAALALTPSTAAGTAIPHDNPQRPPASTHWRWPSEHRTIVEPFRAPAHRYGPGHRGMDLHVPEGTALHAPAEATVYYSGRVVDREVITLDMGDDILLSLEAVSDSLPTGTAVQAGDVIAHKGGGGSHESNTLHVGVRVAGEYVNPELFFHPVERAVLLPCCE